MANKKITLKDSTETDNLYPATLTSQVFNEDGDNVDTLLDGLKVSSLLKSKTVSGTTDAKGYIMLGLNNAYSVIYLRSTISDHQVNLTTGSTSWWARITLNGAAVANTSVTINVKYFEF